MPSTTPPPINTRVRNKVRTKMSSVCSLTLTDEQIDALIVEVWRMSRDDEVIFDLRCDQFMNAMNTWWDTPTLRVG